MHLLFVHLGIRPHSLKLHVSCESKNVSLSEINRLTSEHPFLKDLKFDGVELTSDKVILIIRQLNSLKKFRVLLKNRFELNRLLNQKGNEWKLYTDGVQCARYIRALKLESGHKHWSDCT